MLDDADAPPPTMAPVPSTTRARPMLGRLPSSSVRPASLPSPVIVPMASKKLASTSVNTSRLAASTPMRVNAPKMLTSPTRLRSGSSASTSGAAGTLRFQPWGFTPSDGPTPATASMIAASTVVTTMPISRPPRTLRTTRTPISSTPNTNVTVGQEEIDPLMPRPTGTVVPARPGCAARNRRRRDR